MDQENLLYPSPRSWRMRRLLRRRGYQFEVLDTTADAEMRARLVRFEGRTTNPYVFVDYRLVEGFGEVRALAHSGELDRLMRG